MNDCYKIAFTVLTNFYHLYKYKIDEIKSLLYERYVKGNTSYFCDYQAASAVA